MQTVEKTAEVIGRAELASQNVYDGLQFSLRSQLEVLLILGLTEEQKTHLLNLGYTEEDVAEIMDSLLHYNDYYHHATTGFTPEEVEWFHSMGLTDAQIVEMQTAIQEQYTQVRTYQEVVKQQQTELLYVGRYYHNGSPI